jgi:hypothetical protein
VGINKVPPLRRVVLKFSVFSPPAQAAWNGLRRFRGRFIALLRRPAALQQGEYADELRCMRPGVEADHSCTALCSLLLSTPAYWVSTPAYCDMLQVDVLSFSLLRFLLVGLNVFDFFVFFVSSSDSSLASLDCRLRLQWFRSACSRSLWGLVLGLALVLIYDENRMGGVFVFIIMFSFMIRVAPPRRDPLQPGAAHHPVHSLCSRLLPWCHDIVPCAVHLCLLAQKTVRSSSSCVGVLLVSGYTQVQGSLAAPP